MIKQFWAEYKYVIYFGVGISLFLIGIKVVRYLVELWLG